MHVSGSDLSHQRSRRVALAERPNWEGCPDKRSDADPRTPIPGPGQAQVMTLSVGTAWNSTAVADSFSEMLGFRVLVTNPDKSCEGRR